MYPRFKTTVYDHPLENAGHLNKVECSHSMEMPAQFICIPQLGSRP
jgi:hypothetical protein